MKIWIERDKYDDFLLHCSEPTEVDSDGFWINKGLKGMEAEIDLVPNEQSILKKHIGQGQVAEFELKKCWESI